MAGSLRGRDVTATVVSAMVGAGIFLTPGLLLRQGASAPVILLLVLLAGIVSMAGSFTLAELASRHPGNGGPYRYLREEIGPGAAFLFNWSRFWVMQTGALAILSLTCIRFAADALGFAHAAYWEAVAAIGLLVATALVNARGLRLGALVQQAMTLLKVGALLALIVGVLIAARSTRFPTPPGNDLAGGLGPWMLLVIFAFGGWTQVTFMAGELRRSGDLPRPLAAGVLGVTALYLLAVAAMLLAVPDGGGGEVVAAEAAGALWGDSGRTAVAAVIAVAVLGGLHTMTLTGPRLYAAAAAAGHWWAPFSRRNRFDAPGRAIGLQAEWAALLVALSLLAENAFVALIGSLSAAIWMFHIATAVAWFRHRMRGGHRGLPFRTPGGMVTAGLFLAAATFVVVVALWQDLRLAAAGHWGALTALWALLWVGAGGVAYLALRRRSALRGDDAIPADGHGHRPRRPSPARPAPSRPGRGR